MNDKEFAHILRSSPKMNKEFADILHLGLLRWHQELNKCRQQSQNGIESTPYMCHILMDLCEEDRITMAQLTMALDRISDELDPWYSLWGYLSVAQNLPSSPLDRFCWYRKWIKDLYEPTTDNRAAVLRNTSE